MSLLTNAYLLEKYGPLLTISNLSELLHIEKTTIRNQMSARTLGIEPIKRGKEPLFHAQDVATYIDSLRKAA